ncbi:MAG TPA: hypothetical protein VGF56_06735 [Rhizomicrobium sp.]|jgi:hypothetical protein
MEMVVRFICLVLLVLGLMLLGADIMNSLEKDAFTVRSLAQVWNTIDKPSLDGFKAWLEHTAPGSVASAIEYCLNIWAFLPFGLLGAGIAFLGGRGHTEA